MKTLCFGEVLWDIIRRREHLGGAPFNLAAHLARLGARAAIVTRIGKDPRGERILDACKSIGIDTDFVQADPARPTGSVDVALAPGGAPSYVIHENVAWDAVDVDDHIVRAVAQRRFDAFCFGTLAQRAPDMRRGLLRLLDEVRYTHVLYDVNLRQNYFSETIVRESLRRCSIAKLNDEEAERLAPLLFGETLDTESFVRRVARDFGPPTVVVTRGAKGCALLADGQWEEIPSEPVVVADSVGAGDAFAAAFLFQIASGAAPRDAARAANFLGGFVASRSGAIPEYSDAVRVRLGARRGIAPPPTPR